MNAMRMRLFLAAAVLAALGLVAGYRLVAARPPPVTPEVPRQGQDYFAEYGGACGLTLLRIAREAAGPFEYVYPEGAQLPDQRLRPHAWKSGRFKVQGRMTGRSRGDSECGTWPEFEVFDFSPWGPIRRCTSLGAADSSMLLYTEELPKDRYAAEDFVDGPRLPLIQEESCRPTDACGAGERRIEDCTGERWCCRLAPLNEQPQPELPPIP